MRRICVIGSVNMDLVATVDRFPRPGETISGRSFGTFPGGKGANQAVAAARLGADVTMVGKIGEDVFGAEYLDVFARVGVRSAGVERTANASTGIAVIEVDDSGENHIVIVAGANGLVDGAYVDSHRALLESCDIFLMQLEIPMATVVHAASLLSGLGREVILDPAPAVPLPTELYHAVTCITPNETETEVLTGIAVRDVDGARRAIHEFRRRGVRTPIIKAGRAGAYIPDGDDVMLVDGFSVETVDTTAAGDSFNGGFAVALAKSLPLPAAVRYANAVAALSTTAKGAQTAMPTAAQVDRLMTSSGSS